MADAIPPDARKVVLAAVVPCAEWPERKSCTHEFYSCVGCLRDGTRTVVTDIEVRRYQGVIDDATGPTAWREVK